MAPTIVLEVRFDERPSRPGWRPTPNRVRRALAMIGPINTAAAVASLYQP